MPTPEKIKKIAIGIARLFVHPDDHTPYREQAYRQVEAVITQLSNDYCIVPKSKLKEWEIIVDDALKADHVITELAWRFMWERLFGKELFNEEKG